MADSAQALIEEARRFIVNPSGDPVRIISAISLVDRLADALAGSRAAAIEECAQVAENPDDDRILGASYQRGIIAARIRALANGGDE